MVHTILNLFWSTPLFVSGIFVGLMVAALAVFIWPFNRSVASQVFHGGLATSAVCLAFTAAYTIIAVGFTIVVVWVVHLFQSA